MTAQEARKIAENRSSIATQTELKRITEKVQAAAIQGQFSVGTAGISEAVEAILKEQGFKIQILNDRDGNWTIISW